MGADTFYLLLPDEKSGEPLLSQAADLVAECHRLSPAAGGIVFALQPLLRCMNSYYSNKIEGQHTRPADIQRALDRQFDADQKQARKQRLAVAHIEAEQALEAKLSGDRMDLYAPSCSRSSGLKPSQRKLEHAMYVRATLTEERRAVRRRVVAAAEPLACLLPSPPGVLRCVVLTLTTPLATRIVSSLTGAPSGTFCSSRSMPLRLCS